MGSTTSRAAPSTLAVALDDIIRKRLVHSVYQPIVDIASGRLAAYEALARGPIGSLFEFPDELFAAATAAGRLHDLDWLCRLAAFQGAADARLDQRVTLFVNVEPSVLGSPAPRGVAAAWKTIESGRSVMLEVTERALTRRPAELLDAVEWARERGWGVALDDVGANPHSLALLPFVKPDVVKLDMWLVQDRPDAELGRIAATVMAYAERTGATILAEGIETEEHVDRAVTLGATLGQGWYFARPGPLPSSPVGAVAQIPLLGVRPLTSLPTPFETVKAAGVPLRMGRQRVLLAVSHQLEARAFDDPAGPVLLAAFQDASRFTPDTARRYRRLAGHCSFVAAFGAGLAEAPVEGVRGADLPDDDPLRGEWSVVMVGTDYQAALVAADLGDAGENGQRRFEFAVTHRPDLVMAAAESLMRRVVPH